MSIEIELPLHDEFQMSLLAIGPVSRDIIALVSRSPGAVVVAKITRLATDAARCDTEEELSRFLQHECRHVERAIVCSLGERTNLRLSYVRALRPKAGFRISFEIQ